MSKSSQVKSIKSEKVRIVTGRMKKRVNFDQVRFLYLSPIETRVKRIQVKRDNENRFQIALVFTPTDLDLSLIDSELTTASVSQMICRVIPSIIDTRIDWSIALFDAEQVEKTSAETLSSFFPQGFIQDKRVIQEIIQVSSILEQNSCLVSPKSSVFTSFKTNPIPLLSVFGTTVTLTTGPVFRQAIANFSDSQEKTTWIQDSQYIIAGILVLEGIAYEPFSFTIQTGWKFEWEKGHIVTNTETLETSTATKDQTLIIPNTPLVQKEIFKSLLTLQDKPMYTIPQSITTISITNTSDVPQVWTLTQTSVSSNGKDLDSVFEGDTVPSEAGFLANDSWIDSSVFSSTKTKRLDSSIIINTIQAIIPPHSNMRKNIPTITIKRPTQISLSGYTNQLLFVKDNQRMEILKLVPNTPSQQVNDPWIFSLPDGVLIKPESNLSWSGSEIQVSTMSEIDAISSAEGETPAIGTERVFESEMPQVINNVKKDGAYILPSLVLSKQFFLSQRFPQATRWRVTAINFRVNISTSGTTSGSTQVTITKANSTVDVFPHPTEGAVHGMVSTINMIGAWNGFTFNYDTSFYALNGFVWEEEPVFSGTLTKVSSTKEELEIIIPSEASKLFLIKTKLDKSYGGFTLETGPEILAGEFSIPAQDESDPETPLESIVPFLLRIDPKPSSIGQFDNSIQVQLFVRFAATRIE